jgi:phage terminase large subunit-like protein
LTSSALAAPPASLRGDQYPRIESVPPCLSSAGREAVDLAKEAGITLDPWQAHVLDRSLGERGDGKWAAFEVGLIVSRQNGKGTILEARELAGLFLFGEQLLLHSAHEFKTASDAFRRIARLIEDNRQFERHVRRIRTANGSEMIELKSGQRLRFVARSAGSGRGFTADTVILDEAYELGDAAMAALLPTLSARPNPQVWYASTAGNPLSVQLGRIRRRGMKGADQSLAFFEWSADDGDDPADPATWAKANPGMGIRILPEYIGREQAALSAEAFASERLSIGNYPDLDGGAWGTISQDAWTACAAKSPVAL